MNAAAEKSSQKGQALAVVMLVLVGLAALGALFMTTARVETQISGNRMRHSSALYLAEAGLSEAVSRLSDPSSASYIGEDMTAPHPGWGTYLVLRSGASAGDPSQAETASDGLDNDIDSMIDETEESYPEVLSIQSTNNRPLNYPWVRVSYSLDSTKAVIRYGDHDNDPTTLPRKNLVEGVPVISVTSCGERANARRMLEVELVRTPGPFVDAAIYIEGDSLKFNGQRFRISGQDFNPATGDTVPGSSRKHAIVTTHDPNGILDSLDPSQYDQVIGSGGEGDVAGTSYDLDLEGYIAEYSPLADVHYYGDTNYPNADYWGGVDDYHIVYVEDGNLTASGGTEGGGLLLVDGDFKAAGQFTWYGMMIILGEVNFAGGGHDVHIYGALLAGSGIARNDISGNADILYSSSALRKLGELKGFQVLSWREL